MINIFLSFSSKDCKSIKYIIDYLDSLPSYYKLLYFLPPYKNDNSMDDIKKAIQKADLFILFFSHNSLHSEFVQEELEEAIRLSNESKIRSICSIILANNIDENFNDKIPVEIRNHEIYFTESDISAARTVKNFILKYSE